jgi:hypothetical protein
LALHRALGIYTTLQKPPDSVCACCLSSFVRMTDVPPCQLCDEPCDVAARKDIEDLILSRGISPSSAQDLRDLLTEMEDRKVCVQKTNVTAST